MFVEFAQERLLAGNLMYPSCKFGIHTWGFAINSICECFERQGTHESCATKTGSLQGGVIKKKSQWRVRFKPYLLAVEDPQQPGRDIAAGTFNVQRVRTDAGMLHNPDPFLSVVEINQ